MIPVILWKHFQKDNRDHETRAVGAAKRGQGLPAGCCWFAPGQPLRNPDAERLTRSDT